MAQVSGQVAATVTEALLPWPLVVLLFLDGYEPQRAKDVCNAVAKLDHATIVEAFTCEVYWAELALEGREN